MSFWPFSSSYNNNSNLLKFLDSILDFSTVTVDSLLDDRTLQQEFISELKTLSLKAGSKNGFQLVQLLLNDNPQSKNNAANVNSDAASVSSNNDLSGGSLSKSAREAKLLELLLQPHILNGFLDYIVLSVDYYHDLANLPENEGASEGSPQGSDGEDFETRHRRLAAMMGEGDDENSDERIRRCIQCSAEVLSADMWVISNRIIETPVIMNKLWLIMSLTYLLESTPSVTYLVQILDHLMDLNSIELLNYIRRQEDLVDTFLNKIDIPILMDFFLKVIQTDKPDSPTGILDVLYKQRLVPKLVNILKPTSEEVDEEDDYIINHEQMFRQTAATEFIKALVTISSNASLAVDPDANIGPNQLTRELASPEIVKILIEEIILARIVSKNNPSVTYTNKHGISNCVAILIELIRKNNSDYDSNCGTYSSQLQNSNEGTGEVSVQVMYHWLKDFDQNPPGLRDPVFLGGLLTVFSEYLEDLVKLMDIDPHVPLTLNRSSEILGVTKFKISELIAELLHCSNMILLNSRKIASIILIRDKVRELQERNLLAAIDDTILDRWNDDVDVAEGTQITGVTSGLDEVSIHDVHPDRPKKKPKHDDQSEFEEALPDDQEYRKIVSQLEYEDSDDDEPNVSAESPFVNPEREEALKIDPCLGDSFKMKLKELGMLLKIVSKFTLYPWHNFFHNVVFDLIQQIFNGKLNSYNSFLIVELFRLDKCAITDIIVNCFRDEVVPRPGYMGHLILVSEEVVKFTSLYKPALISPMIVEAVGSEDWEWFVNEILLKTREMYNVILGADSEYLQDDEHSGDKGEEDAFGFDSSTVGYMDLEPYENKKSIILGDVSNHDEFLQLKSDQDAEADDELQDDNQKIANVSIENMSPKGDFENNDFGIFDDFEEKNKFTSLQDNDYLDNLLGSSSSDDEEDSHQLRRVRKHYD